MNLKINIPTDQSEINLGQYQKFYKIIEQNENAKNSFINQKMIEIFCGVSLAEIMNFTVRGVDEIAVKLEKVINQQPSFRQSFKIGSIEFGFIPDLEVMTFGEFIDLENSITSWETMHKAMAVLYRPIKKRIGESYTIEDYEPNTHDEAMRQTPFDAVTGALVFFSSLGKDLQKGILRYLEDHHSKIIAEAHNLTESGDGFTQFTNSLTEMLEGLKILQN